MTDQDVVSAYIAEVVANAPPLTTDQRAALTALLRPPTEPRKAADAA